MDFIEFQDSITKELEQRHPNDKVKVETMTKNNNLRLTGVCIIKDGIKCSPVVYLESFYNSDITTGEIHDVVCEIERVIEEHSDEGLSELVSNLNDFNYAKEKIFYQVINTEKNQSMLEKCPNRSVLDVSVVYKINVFDERAGEATISIKNDLMKMWGVTEEDLWRCAIKNTPLMFPLKYANIFKTMSEIVERSDDELPKMLLSLLNNDEGLNLIIVVTNKQMRFGASTILYKDVLKKISDEFSKNYYIALSSIHEFLIFPKDKTMEPDELKSIVKSVNREQVSIEEVLSDNVYYYDGELDKLSIVQ